MLNEMSDCGRCLRSLLYKVVAATKASLAGCSSIVMEACIFVTKIMPSRVDKINVNTDGSLDIASVLV